MKTKLSYLLLAMLLLAACTTDTSLDQLVTRDGYTYLVNSDQPFTGTARSHYSNGQLEIETNYMNGIEEGTYTSYWENGQLKEKAILVNGRKDGLYELFWPNGSPMQKKIFANGIEMEVMLDELAAMR